ncbi:MAG: hypothetical protein IPN75_15030 [Dechloromonas sp.]|uniref:Oxaloacetate decarboxylase gamma chain n=1 Tax=Candidatus Dechloromonas phosphorivorans TaxID=2899244 RepID=A0A9D7QMB0_9RHOO|nr:hypothetical protein [Candidatus Dechloromonas phosphorivorans]
MSEVIIRTLWIYGLTIIVSLAVAVIIKAIVVTLNMLERKPAAPAQPAAVPPVPFAVEADHIVAIAAAVYAMANTHRIVRIEATPHQPGWAAGGRQAHHASHTLPHHPKR